MGTDFVSDAQFLSTLSLRRATGPRFGCAGQLVISIHALLAESDNQRFKAQVSELLFLSTLSLRRATRYKQNRLQCNFNFYPRSPCGERRVHYDNYNLHCVISIHALLAESDLIAVAVRGGIGISIHALLAESDPCWPCRRPCSGISIHALLAESDDGKY